MDWELEALRRLLRGTKDSPAGLPDRRKQVAQAAGVSADNLYQVACGIPLKSGRPRRLGRDVKERLEAAFPGWLTPPNGAQVAVFSRIDGDGDAGSPPLSKALPVVLDAMVACQEPGKLRTALIALLEDDSPSYRERVAMLLHAAPQAKAAASA